MADGVEEALEMEAGCAVCYGLWQGGETRYVAETRTQFANVCVLAGDKLDYKAEYSAFLDWFDDLPREVVFRLLAEELEQELGMAELDELSPLVFMSAEPDVPVMVGASCGE